LDGALDLTAKLPLRLSERLKSSEAVRLFFDYRQERMSGREMRRETISIHGGCTFGSSTKAVASPVYQNVAYEFDSADHGAALLNLEAPAMARYVAFVIVGRGFACYF
jgi:hypothetical protein